MNVESSRFRRFLLDARLQTAASEEFFKWHGSIGCGRRGLSGLDITKQRDRNDQYSQNQSHQKAFHCGILSFAPSDVETDAEEVQQTE